MIIIAREYKADDMSVYSRLDTIEKTLSWDFLMNAETESYEKDVSEDSSYELVGQHVVLVGSFGGESSFTVPDELFNEYARFLEEVKSKSISQSENGTYFPQIGVYGVESTTVKIPKLVESTVIIEKDEDGDDVERIVPYDEPAWEYDYVVHADRRYNVHLISQLGMEVKEEYSKPEFISENKGRSLPLHLWCELIKRYQILSLELRGAISIVKGYEPTLLRDNEFWRIFQESRMNSLEDEEFRKMKVKGTYEMITFPKFLAEFDLDATTLLSKMVNDSSEVYQMVSPDYQVVLKTYETVLKMPPLLGLERYRELELKRIELRQLLHMVQVVFYDSMDTVVQSLPRYAIVKPWFTIFSDNLDFKYMNNGIVEEYKIKFSFVEKKNKKVSSEYMTFDQE